MKISIASSLLLLCLGAPTAHGTSSLRGNKVDQDRKLAVENNGQSSLLHNIRRAHTLKQDAPIIVQYISDDNTVVVKGKEYSLNGLEEFTVRSPDFHSSVDGVKVPPVETRMFTGTDATTGVSITLVYDENGQIDFIQIRDGTEETTLVPVDGFEPGAFLTVSTEDYDSDVVKHFAVKGKGNHSDHRKMQQAQCTDVPNFIDSFGDNCAAYAENPDWCATAEQYTNADGRHARQECCACGGGTAQPRPDPPRGGCNSLRTIDVAIAYDTSFCLAYGGQAGAQRRIEEIVAVAKVPYETEGICATIRLAAGTYGNQRYTTD